MNEVLGAVLGYAWRVITLTATQLLILVGPPLALGLVLSVIAGAVERFAYRGFGGRGYLLVFGWLGTIVHEGSHALACLLFGHRITSIKWFDPDAHGGSFGCVNHSYDPRSPYQVIGNFFIGIAPLIGGTAFAYAATTALMGPEVFGAVQAQGLFQFDARTGVDLSSIGRAAMSMATAAKGVVAAIVHSEHLLSWRLPVLVYLLFCVGSSITLSRDDLKGAAEGFIALVVLVLLVNALTAWTNTNMVAMSVAISRSYSAFTIAIGFALLMNVLAALAVLGVSEISRAFRMVTGRPVY